MKQLRGCGGSQLAYNAFFVAWAAWTVAMLVRVPWMIQTHAPRTYMGRSMIGASSSPLQGPVTLTHYLQLPRWDSVRTYNLLAIIEIDTLGMEREEEKTVVAHIHAHPCTVTCVCREPETHVPLFSASWGNLSRSRLTYESPPPHAETLTPRYTAKGMNYGSPRCAVSITCPVKGPQTRLLWEVRVTPHWHWSNWIDRDLADAVNVVFNALVAFVWWSAP